MCFGAQRDDAFSYWTLSDNNKYSSLSPTPSYPVFAPPLGNHIHTLILSLLVCISLCSKQVLQKTLRCTHKMISESEVLVKENEGFLSL